MALAVSYHLFMLPARVVFKARVNTSANPADAASVAFDGVTAGAYTDIQPEMLVLFGSSDGADDHGRARVRKAAASDTLYYGWASRGSGHGEATLTDDDYITVIDQYMPWTRNPRILPDGTQYFDYDLTAPGSIGLPPVIMLNCGAAVHEDINPATSKATFAFDGSSSYVTDADASSISTWSWALPAGATVTSGSTSSSAVTFTIAEGAYWVGVTATDDNGTSQTRRVLCVAGEPTGTITDFAVTEISRRPEGQRLRVQIYESIPEATYPRGTLAALWTRWTDDGVETTPDGLSGRENLAFVGWHHVENLAGRATERGFISETELEFVDVAGKLAELPGYPITIERNSSPSEWHHVKGADMDRYATYILHYMSNALVLADFNRAGIADTYPFPVLASEGQSLYEQVDIRAQAIAHKFSCDQYGRLHVKKDNQLLDASGGNTALARDTSATWTIGEADFTSWRVTNQKYPRYHWNRGNAIQAQAVDASASNAIALFCVAPGSAPGQGLMEITSGEQLVADQDDLNAREGHRYALLNRQYGNYELELATPSDKGIQPAYMGWLALTISSATAGERGVTWTNSLFRPAEMIITPDAETGSQRVIVRVEPSSTGQAAQTYIPPAPDGDLPDSAPPDAVEPDTSASYWMDDTDRIIGFNNDGGVYVFNDVHSSAPSGVVATGTTVDGDPVQWVPNAFSARYLGSGTDVEGWLITTTKIYAVTVTASNTYTATAQHTFRDTTAYRSADFEFGREGYGFVASTYDDGVWVTYTTDGGTTWASESLVGATTPGTGAPSGLTFDGTLTNLASVTASISSWTATQMVIEVTMPDGWFGLAAFYLPITASETITELTVRMKRHELSPVTFSNPWFDTLPANTYVNMPKPKVTTPDSGDAGTDPDKIYATDDGNDGEWQYWQWTFSPGRSPYQILFEQDGEWRKRPRETASPATVTGTVEIYSVNGVTSTPLTDQGSPGAYVSTKTANRVLSTAYYGSTGQGVYSNDSGDTMARGLYAPADMQDIDSGYRVANDLHVPFGATNELTCFHGTVSSGGAYGLTRVETDGTTQTDISPSYGGETYGPWKSRGQVATYVGDPNLVWCIGTNDGDVTKVGIWRSTNGGDTWTTLITPATGTGRYTRLAVSGANPALVWFWGENGAFGVSYDGGVTIRDLTTLTGLTGAGEFIGIAGG